MVERVWNDITTLIPPAGALFLGWVIWKHLVEGDRRERAAHAKWERKQDEREAREKEKNNRVS